MELIQGIFLERVNRFVVKVKLLDEIHFAYLPNPGRLWELLLAGTNLFLSPSPHTKYKYTVIASLKENHPVLLHTHLTNKLIKKLLLNKKLEFYSSYDLIREEPSLGEGRVDFLLRDNHGRELYLEVKTCTLFGSKLAMFPDAETKRGTRHLYELASLSSATKRGSCLFVVMNPNVEYFLPAYHIDIAFTQAFIDTFSKIEYRAIAVSLNEDFSEIIAFKELKIPLSFLQEEFGNWGAYLLILENVKDRTRSVGSLGPIKLKRGYYVYVGSGCKNLSQRLARYQRVAKKKHWHIDYLLGDLKLIKIIPFISKEQLECELSKGLFHIAEDIVKDFGSSDCNCLSHLYYFKENPIKIKKFVDLVNEFRLERPLKKILKIESSF